MWHTIFTLLKEKGEEGQNKKYFAKKMERRKSKLIWCSQAHTRKDRERFFFEFCDFVNFFLNFWVLFLQYVA